MERTRASVITKNSSRGIWSSWPINKDVDENRWPEEYSAKLGVIRMTSVHQGGFSVDSIQYSAEGGKGEAERWVHTSRTLIPLGPVIVGHISWSTMPGNSVGKVATMPAGEIFPGNLFGSSAAGSRPELKFQKRKQSAPVFCSQSDRSLRVDSTWPTA